MNITPKIKSQNGKDYVIFSVSRDLALEIINKKETHNFSFDIEDRRAKSYEQIKLFWGFLNEFVDEFFNGKKISKEEKEKIKLALYDEYAEEKGIKIKLSKTNVTNARLFIDWCINKFAQDYGFISKNLELQNEFNDSYVYSSLIAKKCAVCQENGHIKEYKGKYISLCDKHKEIEYKDLLEAYYLKPIKISEEMKEFLEE